LSDNDILEHEKATLKNDRSMRSTSLLLVFCLSTLVVLGLAHRSSYRFLASNAEEGFEGETESLGEESLFWTQRFSGSPNVDFNERLWTAYQQVRTIQAAGLNKSQLNPSNTWTSHGPVNITGRIRALAMHAADPNTIYAGAASGGVWKSTSFGLDWMPLTDGMTAMAIGALAIDPTDPNRIYAGTGEPTNINGVNNTHGWGSPAYTGLGVLTSSDAGQSWRLLPWPASKSMIHRIAVHPVQSDTVFAASTANLFRTTNKGQNWTSTLTGCITDLAYRPGAPAVVYAAVGNNYGSSSNGVYVSEAGGRSYSWRKLSKNFPSGDSTGRILFAISPTNPNRMYAAVSVSRNLLSSSDPNDFLLLCVSTDAGETWERKIGAVGRSIGNGQLYYDFVLGVLPTDPNVVFLGGVDLWRSKNGGGTFAKISDWRLRMSNMNSPGYLHADQHAIAFKPDNGTVVLEATDGGIHISSNGGDGWAMRNQNLVTTQFYSCNYDRATSPLFYGGTQDQSNQRQPSSGAQTWAFLGGGDGGSTAADPLSTSIFYVVINGTVNRSTNGGASYKELSSGIGSSDRVYYWRPMLLHPNDKDLLFCATQYVYKMRNPGTTVDPSWVVSSEDLTAGMSVISDMAIAPTNPDVMYVVTGNGKAARSDNIRALDVTWTGISTGLPSRWLTRISVDWNDPMTAYIAASGYGGPHAYKTTNGGANWTSISGDLPDIPAGAIVRSRTDVHTLFLATDLGVWYTTNDGANWRPFGSGLPNLIAYDMKMLPNGDLLVGSYGRGMWTTSSVTDAEPTPTIMPNGISLGQMYPQPLRSGQDLHLPLSLSGPSRVEITAYAADGTRALVGAGAFQAGHQTMTVSSSGLAPGVYLVRATAGGRSASGKFVVIE
jgi:hypothetical protein